MKNLKKHIEALKGVLILSLVLLYFFLQTIVFGWMEMSRYELRQEVHKKTLNSHQYSQIVLNDNAENRKIAQGEECLLNGVFYDIVFYTERGDKITIYGLADLEETSLFTYLQDFSRQSNEKSSYFKSLLKSLLYDGSLTEKLVIKEPVFIRDLFYTRPLLNLYSFYLNCFKPPPEERA